MANSNKRITPFLKQCFVCATVSCNGMGIACTTGYPAILLPQLQAPGSPITLTKDQQSWIASVLAMSWIGGLFLIPIVMGRYGRRTAHQIVTLPYTFGWLCILFANSFEALLVGRILQGLSTGMYSPLRAVLLGEYSSPKNRGAFVAVSSFALSIGIFLVHLVGALVGWQWTALISLVFPFASFVMTLYCPESPSFLAAKGKYEKSRQTFLWLRGPEEELELNRMIKSQMIAKSETTKLTFRGCLAILKKKEFYKPVTIMVHFYGALKCCGTLVLTTYATVIISAIMGPNSNANFWMVFLDSQRVIFGVISIYVVRKFKRRLVIFIGGGLCILSNLLIAGFVFGKREGYFYNCPSWVPVSLLSLMVTVITLGVFPMPFVIGGEIFPLKYRSFGSSVSSVANCAMMFTVLKSFPTLVDGVGLDGTFFIYAGLLTYLFSVIWFLLPETKGKTLQQIEEEFRGEPLIPDDRDDVESFKPALDGPENQLLEQKR